MAITNPVSIPVVPGMREDLSEHLAPAGTLTYAKNVRFPVSGEAVSRPGTFALSAATSAQIPYVPLLIDSLPEYLQGCPGGFLFGCKGFGYRYDFEQARVHAAGSYSNALPEGRLVSMAREELQPAGGTAVPWPLSQAYAGGYVAVMYSGGNGQGNIGPATDSWFCQIFTVDGTLVSSLHQFAVGTASAGWVVADDSNLNSFVVIKQDGAILYAAVVTLSAAGASLGAFASIDTMFSAASYWAACNWPGLGWALTYQSAGALVKVARMAGTNFATSTVSYANTGVAPISIYCDTTNCYVGYVDVNFAPGDCVARARVYDASLTLTSGVGAIEMCRDVGTAALTLGPPLFGTSALASTAFCVVGRSQGPGIYGSRTRAMTLTAAGTLVSAGTDGDVYGLMPVSAPFNNGMYWARFEMGNAIPSLRNMLMDYQTDRVGTSYLKNPKVALVTEQFVNLVGSGYPGGLYRHHLGTPVALPLNDVWVCGLPRVVRLETHLSSSQGLTIAEWVKFSTEHRRVAPAFAGSAIIPGDPVFADHPWGTLIEATAATAANQGLGSDIGFYAAPTGGASPSTTGPGSLNISSNYQYRIVMERIDARGERDRSAPSAAISMTTSAANNTGTVSALYPSNILRSYARSSSAFDPAIASKVVMHVYRTQAGATSAGATFYRCTPPQGAPVPVAGAATYVDQLSDANLITREVLYTDGGVLNNDHPPSCRYAALTEDRLWLGGLFDAEQIQSSKIKVPGEGFAFSDSPAFRVVLPAPCTGIACQDGTVVAFTASAIYAVQGGGPNDQGQGAWDTPRVITRSTGCVDGQSIVETSAGIFFRSDRGIELLPRGFGEPVFVGAGVQDSFAAGGLGDLNVDLLSAAVITSTNTRTVRFCIGGPVVLVYDLDTHAWSADVYPGNVAAICDTDQGAVIALSDPTTGGFGFYLENGALGADAVGDAATSIPCELRWAGVHPFTIAGWGRFNSLVGMFAKADSGYQGSCTIEAETGWFAKSTSSVTFSMTAMADPDFRQLVPEKMDGSYIRPRLTTTASGWRFMGWTLDMDQHPGSRRMAASERG